MPRVRRVAAALAAVALATLPLEPPANAAGGSLFEERVVDRINDRRDGLGLPRVRHGACADLHAELWAARLARRGTFVHRDQGVILEACDVRMAGEVMAYGYGTPRATVRAWMRSDGHRAILADGGYRRIGVGAVRTSDRGWLVVANLVRR